MENVNEKKYHGYFVISRQSRHLRNILGRNLFHFYIDLVMEARWSRKDKKTFGKVMMTQSELAKELEIDQGTISKNLDALLKRDKKSIIKNKRSITLCYLPLFIHDVASRMVERDYADWNEVYEDMNKINAEIQNNYEKKHSNRTQKHPQSINISSKVSTSLSEDDQEWITNNVR